MEKKKNYNATMNMRKTENLISFSRKWSCFQYISPILEHVMLLSESKFRHVVVNPSKTKIARGIVVSEEFCFPENGRGTVEFVVSMSKSCPFS